MKRLLISANWGDVTLRVFNIWARADERLLRLVKSDSLWPQSHFPGEGLERGAAVWRFWTNKLLFLGPRSAALMPSSSSGASHTGVPAASPSQSSLCALM